MESFLARSWLFEIVDSRTGNIEESFTLVLPPQSYTIREKGRVSITKTFGNAFIDDYGSDNIEITIKGISGTAHAFPTFRTQGTSLFSPTYTSYLARMQPTSPLGYTGRAAFHVFRDTIMRYRDRSDYDKKEMRVYDLYDEQAYKCVLLEFSVDRNADKPFWYPFTISLFVYARLNSKRAARPSKVDISGDPFNILNTMDELLAWYDKAARSIQSIINGAARVLNSLNLVRARLSSSLTTARGIIESPLKLSKNLIDTVFSFGGVIRNAWEEGKVTAENYANILEVWEEVYRQSLSLYGFAIQEGAQQSREEVLPVDKGVTVETGEPDRSSVLETFSFDSVTLYTIKNEDTLQSIAQSKLGDENLWAYIASINSDITGNADIYAGLKIYIPAPSPEGISKDSFIMTEDTLRDPYGVDIRLDSDGNIIVQESNDVALISGIENVKQAINLRFNTLVGSMLKQTAFGLAAQAGQAGTDDALSYARMSLANALIQDPRVEKVENVTVRIEGDAVTASMDIIIVGAEATLPVSVTI